MVGRVSCAALALTVAAPVAAQDWNVTAQAGRIRSALDPAAAATESVALGLRYDRATTGLRLFASVPTRAGEPLWSALGAWTRLASLHRGFVAGVDVSGNAFLAHDRTESPDRGIPGLLDSPTDAVIDRSGHALAGQALPVLGFESQRVQVHARAGVSYYTAEFGAQQHDRTVRLVDVQLTITPTGSFAILPVVRRFAGNGEEPATYAGLSAIAAAAPGSMWGTIGHWSNDAAEGMPWSAGARLRLHRLVSLEGSARHDAFDPLYEQPPQTSWSVGVLVRVGGRAPAAAPVPAAYVNGRATIRLALSESATQPSIAGDFNGWKAAPMQRAGNDWTYTVAVEPGVYNYSFVAPDGEWFVPKSVAGRRADGMGGHIAVLVVR
jgi:hypothetical protein